MGTTQREIEAQDKRFEALIRQALFSVSDSEFTPERRAERRADCDGDAMAFCKTYFPRVFTSPFNDLHRHLSALDPGNYSISGFPQSGKTAFSYCGLMIRHIALGGQGMCGIGLRTLVHASQRTSGISRIIRQNDLLIYDYEIEIIQDLAGWHIFESGGDKDRRTTLVAGSVNTGLRNFIDDEFSRFALFIADDTYNRTTVSPLDNEKVESWVTGEVWRQMEIMPKKGLSLFLCNMISQDCPGMRLKTKHPEHHFSFPIKEANGDPSWPERYTVEAVDELEAEHDFDVWEGEFMDDPGLKGDIMDVEWLRFVNINLLRILHVISVIDPSFGTSPAASDKGIATLGMVSNTDLIVLDMYLRKDGWMDVFNYLHMLRLRFPEHRAFLFENDFSQFALAQPYLLNWLNQNEMLPPLNIVTFLASGLLHGGRGAAKDSRIMALVHPHQSGILRYNATLEKEPDFLRYRKQYLSYGKAKIKLDGLDALASAYILIRAYLASGGFQVDAVVSQNFQQPSWMDERGFL